MGNSSIAVVGARSNYIKQHSILSDPKVTRAMLHGLAVLPPPTHLRGLLSYRPGASSFALFCEPNQTVSVYQGGVMKWDQIQGKWKQSKEPGKETGQAEGRRRQSLPERRIVVQNSRTLCIRAGCGGKQVEEVTNRNNASSADLRSRERCERRNRERARTASKCNQRPRTALREGSATSSLFLLIKSGPLPRMGT